jgi:hypothetical protein
MGAPDIEASYDKRIPRGEHPTLAHPSQADARYGRFSQKPMAPQSGSPKLCSMPAKNLRAKGPRIVAVEDLR